MDPPLALNTVVVHQLTDRHSFEFSGRWGNFGKNPAIPLLLRQLGIINQLLKTRQLGVPKLD